MISTRNSTTSGAGRCTGISKSMRARRKLLREEADLVDVVVTHWPPTRDAIAPRFKGDALNGYFVNDCEDLVEDIGAQLWISGHVHDPYRAVVGNTAGDRQPDGLSRRAAGKRAVPAGFRNRSRAGRFD